MYYKMKSKNPYRDFLFHVRRIHRANLSDVQRAEEYHNLYRVIRKRLLENESLLNASPAFSKRCEYWNQRDVTSIKPVRNTRNPWLAFKREFEQALSANYLDVGTRVSIALAWFSANTYSEDWIND